MLIELHIRDFTIIEKTDLSFTNGMTVLTGETGAGKSILVDALSFILGCRADSKYIRHCAEVADISAIFLIEGHNEALQFLVENDFLADPAEPCLLRRVLSREGRSKAYINGHPASLSQLKILGNHLVNIHGQHEHYALMKRECQLARLDHYADHTDLLVELKKSFNAWKHTENQIHELAKTQAESNAKHELLAYQVTELQQLDLSENEWEALNAEQNKLSHAQELISLCSNSLQVLYENERDTVLGQLNSLHKQFKDSARQHPELSTINTLLNDAIINVQECSHELRDYHDRLSLDPERLEAIEQRMQAIHAMARKHHIPTEQLYAHYCELEQQLRALSHLDANVEKLTAQLKMQAEQYQKIAEKLSLSRRKIAKTLSQKVQKSMQELGMEGGKFIIEFETLSAEQFSVHGIERVQFMTSVNPGQPLMPMSDVVSGGELSRIGLAIQVLTAERSATPTLIFDEVDTGIGGGTAEVVGKLLRKLGEHCQVMCVTHLPQVAAQAFQHIHVEKLKAKTHTASHVHTLDKLGRQRELARMLGGIEITESTLKHAQEMLEKAE
ncbi:MAG: DNA repair protein RecN [Gammaproteobacteria bacterium]|nr:DNA repair protein RecN [Gammaproteobacteria bacterium]